MTNNYDMANSDLNCFIFDVKVLDNMMISMDNRMVLIGNLLK